jgi:processive 1,2-diacylglycerol beta-glucosyltransferase
MSSTGGNRSRRRVLIVTASVGEGHRQAAGALADALRAAAPGVELDVVDVLTLAPWVFGASYAGGYSLAVSKFPRLYGLGFWLSDRPQGPRRSLNERLRLWHEGCYLRRLQRRVLQTRPDLVVHTHFVSSAPVARLIRQGLFDRPHVVVVTDIRMHRFWLCEEVDHWFVPAEPTAQRLRRWGVRPERITVSGIPIHPKWTGDTDRQKVLAEWRLPAGRPLVLLAGGAEFTCGPIVRIARELRQACGEAFVGVLAGRNKKLLGRLCRLPGAGRDLAGFAFTDRVQELVSVCTLMVTKAGGLSTAECLAKGTPMVLLPPVPGQESGNGAYLAAEGAAVVARDVREVVAQVRRLLGDAEALARMGDCARRLHRPGTETIVAAIRRAVCV